MEVWKVVPGTGNKIEVSNEGRMRSLLRGNPYVLKAQKDSKGYYRVRVTVDRIKITYKVHREVAKAFLPNPSNCPQVNHIDGDKTNNAVSNLEWCTNHDNALHAIKNGLWENNFKGAKAYNSAKKKPVIATKGTEKRRFASVGDAERYLNSRHVTDVLKGKRSHIAGWQLVYESEVT